MAEVDVKSSGGKGSPKQGVKRTSTKVDMTAMVDLAFLLITFFMLTTTMAKPQTMEITMPDKQKGEQETMKTKASRTVTVLLGEDDKVFWYQGVNDPDTPPQVNTTHFGKDGIRKALLQKKQEIGKVRNPKTGNLEDGIIVIIKARDTAKYKNMVDILDEMSITDIGVYAIVDITPEDLDLIDVAKGLPPADAAAPAA